MSESKNTSNDPPQKQPKSAFPCLSAQEFSGLAQGLWAPQLHLVKQIFEEHVEQNKDTIIHVLAHS